MKRSKLPVSASLPPGSMPPTSTWYAVPRCFACDDPIKSHRFSTSLLQGHTHYTHSSIPGKLGEYIGDGFVVVVTSEDALCRTCMNLLNTMDRLEEELKDHRNKLVGNLRRKYGLDPGGFQAAARPNRKIINKVEDDDDIIEIQSDEEWTPRNKKRKVTPSAFPRSKTLTCNVCKMEFVDLNRFMTHLKMHREAAQQAKEELPTSSDSEALKSFKCGCCTLSFDKKESLAIHMKQHTGDQLLSRSAGSTSMGDKLSLMRSHHPSNPNNGNKLFPKPTSETVVDMKLILDAGPKKPQNSPPMEKPVTVTKFTDQDPGGKVCLLALWNSGSCTDHIGCQDPACGSENHPKTTFNVQQTSQTVVTQHKIPAPKLVVRQTQDNALKMPIVSQSQYQITTSVGQQSNLAIIPSISQANTHVITIPHSGTTQTQLPVNISGSTQHIVVSIPNQSSIKYNIPSKSMSPENQEIILNTSDNNLPMDIRQSADTNEKIVLVPSENISDQNSNDFQAQLPSNILNCADSADKNKPSKSMPLLDDIVPAESTNVGMENIPIVNAEGNEVVEDETDWYLASEQSNAVMEEPRTVWGQDYSQDYSQDSAKSAIDQVDGAPRSSGILPLDVREQSDSVDENEKSAYFSSRYAVDSEMRQVAEELGNAIFAAFRT